MATNGVKYNKPARELGKRELHRLLISEGLTFNQLHERTGIPKRTLSRWLSQMYKEDNALLITPTKEQVALATSIYKERLQHMYQRVLDEFVFNDKIEDTGARVEAMNMAVNLLHAAWKLEVKTGSTVVREMPIALVRKVESMKQQQQLLPPPLASLTEEQKRQLQQESREKEAWGMANQRGELGPIGSAPPQWWLDEYRKKKQQQRTSV